jgi:hypothetical protein
VPISGFTFLRSFATHDFTSSGSSTLGKIAVWGMTDFLQYPVKLDEQTIPGPIATNFSGLNIWEIPYNLNLASYTWLAFSVDPAWSYDSLQPSTAIQYAKQSNFISPYYGMHGPVEPVGHLGIHVVGSTFGATFPVIPETTSSKYLITKWCRIGLAP